MAECVVTCQVCKDEEGKPKKWRYLCEDCADEQGHRHRRDTGHACDTLITRPANLSAFRMISDAGRWWERRE